MDKIKVTLRSHTPKPELLIQDAMLCCRNLWPDLPYEDYTLEERIESIHKTQHVGIFEHPSATFIIQGVSRVMSHQAVRHRIGMSYAQLSQRAYPTDKLDVIVPNSFKENPDVEAAFMALTKHSNTFFAFATEQGIEIEDSRFGALNAVETQLFVTGTFQAWLHFLKLRLGKHAQWEIKRAAVEIWERLREISPNVFSPEYKKYWV